MQRKLKNDYAGTDGGAKMTADNIQTMHTVL